MSNFLPRAGDEFIRHCDVNPSADGKRLVTKVVSMEPVTKEKPKSEAEKLQDLLRDVGTDAFCKIMAETIEKHNELHKHVVSNLETLLNSGLITRAGTATYVSNMILSINRRLDK